MTNILNSSDGGSGENRTHIGVTQDCFRNSSDTVTARFHFTLLFSFQRTLLVGVRGIKPPSSVYQTDILSLTSDTQNPRSPRPGSGGSALWACISTTSYKIPLAPVITTEEVQIELTETKNIGHLSKNILQLKSNRRRQMRQSFFGEHHEHRFGAFRKQLRR